MKAFTWFFFFTLLFITVTRGQNFNIDLQTALSYYNSGKYAEAADLLSNWLPVIKDSLGANDTSLYLKLVTSIGNCYFKAGVYKQAEFLMIEALTIYKQMFGENHPSYARALNSLGRLYLDVNRYIEAEPLMILAMEIDTHFYGENHPTYAQDLNNLAQLYSDMNRHEQAKPLMIKVCEIFKNQLGEEHPDYATSLNNLAQLYSDMGRYGEAEPLMIQAFEIDKQFYGENHPTYAMDLNNLARLYQDIGRYDQAEPLMIKAMNVYKQILGEHDPTYALVLNNLAQLYSDMGRFSKAEQLMIQALNIDKQLYGENHQSYARDLNNLARTYTEMGLYNQAEGLIIQALKIDKQILGFNHPYYAKNLLNLALLYSDMGRYDQAEPLLKQACGILKDQLGEEHPDYATSLNNLAQLYSDMGRFDEAEPLMIQALNIDKQLYGENHQSYARDLNNLAHLYRLIGNYEQAERLMKNVINIFKIQLGENHPSFSTAINNLAQLYSDMGRFTEAEQLMIQALNIDKQILGDYHPSYARDLNNLAAFYSHSNRYSEAEPLLIQAMTIDKQILGEHHPNYATEINNLAQLYQSMGLHDKAEQLMIQAMEIDKQFYGENHPYYARDLNNLAVFYSHLDRYSEAESLLIQAMTIDKQILGEHHPDYAGNLNNLTQVYLATGQYNRTALLMKEAFGILVNLFKKNTGYLSEKEVEQFFDTKSHILDVYQSVNTWSMKNLSSTGEFAFDIELYRKGVLLRSAQYVRYRILASGDTSLINGFNQLLSLRKQIEKLCSLDSTKRFDDPVKVEQKANDIEKSLTLKSQDYRQAKEELDYTWKDVLKQIKFDEAVIEFSSFKYYDKRWTDSTYYYVLVLRKDYDYPRMVYLFEEKQINALLPLASASEEGILMTYSFSHEESKAKDLYKLIWAPLEPYLEGVTKIDFAVSGQLNRIAFHALSDTSGNLLLNKYDLVQLSSTREVALPKDDKRLESIAIFGGIDYSIDTSDMLAMAREVNTDNLSRSLYHSDTTSRNLSLTYLPGTMEEASEVRKECQEKGIDVKLFSGKLATEEQFRLLGEKKSPSVIHIATHGFYFPEEKQKDRDDRMRFMQIGQQENQFVYSPDPLIRSGLAMAGANHAWKGEKIPEGLEDGILTARDVSQLNLLNTELVVLSACQTGLGDVKGSEGVYGLQRGFKMAGARYLMMSLWKVPDEATKEFMTNFYGHLSVGMAIRESYRNTQKDMSAKCPDDPFRWAAFVLVE